MLKLTQVSLTCIILAAMVTAAGCRTVPKPSISKKKEAVDKNLLQLGLPIEKGVLFRTFDKNPERLHEGLSFGAPPSTPVVAAQNGEVLFSGEANNDLGKMIVIRHIDPFFTVYGHLESLDVKVGQKVNKGQKIATVGTTGPVESPRVYFQLRKEKLPVDPELYL